MITSPYKLFLTCSRGFEATCSQELKTIGVMHRKLEPGGVSFTGTINDIYKVNYLSRTGMVLWTEICSLNINNEESIYHSIYNNLWEELFRKKTTFSFKCIQVGRKFKNTHFISLKGKDAIVDYFKNKNINRPDVEKNEADLNFLILIGKKGGKLLVNTSGKPLFKRGYRTIKHDAPLNETVASSILKYIGWNSKIPLYDPFCGSGTIPIEAAQIALNIPAGKLRENWGFYHLPEFNRLKWLEIKNKLDLKIIENNPIEIFGSDVDNFSIQSSIIHSKKTGLQKFIKFRNTDIKHWLPFTKNGMIITNPPYGVRINNNKNLSFLYSDFGNILKNKCQGFKVFLICGNRELIKHIGLKTSMKFPLRISKLDGRLVGIEIYKGSKK